MATMAVVVVLYDPMPTGNESSSTLSDAWLVTSPRDCQALWYVGIIEERDNG